MPVQQEIAAHAQRFQKLPQPLVCGSSSAPLFYIVSCTRQESQDWCLAAQVKAHKGVVILDQSDNACNGVQAPVSNTGGDHEGQQGLQKSDSHLASLWAEGTQISKNNVGHVSKNRPYPRLVIADTVALTDRPYLVRLLQAAQHVPALL